MIDSERGNGLGRPFGNYALISAARNEENYLERTIQAVIAQSRLPVQWLIVSDGSTDRTDDIVKRYSHQQPFIKLLRLQPKSERNFGSKALAINTGYIQLKDIPHDFIGILDVDVTFDPDYYEKVLLYMEKRPDLGIVGGILFDSWKGRLIRQNTNVRWSVSGPIQMFRRSCWEQLGGYLNIRGGIDAAAEVMARMRGWKIRTIPELSVIHLRRTGMEKRGLFGAFFFRGILDYELGYHPLFFFIRSFRRITQQPQVLGAALNIAGFSWAWLRRNRRKVSVDFVRFLRQEQMHRLVGLRKELGKAGNHHDDRG